MADNIVRHIAPFINDRFLITSPWWHERINPVTGKKQIHRGLDIATSGSKPVYSMLDGYCHSKGFDSSQGNWVVIKDDNPNSPYYGYATLYMHLSQTADVNVNDRVVRGQKVGDEGTTGTSTGIHLHVEMQDLNRWNNVWHWSYTKSDYLDPTQFMGIDNIVNTWWIYDGEPIEPIEPTKNKNKWLQFKSRKKRIIYW